MSTQTATPLWKQFLGACAGAVAAVMIYEAFLIIPSTLSAWTSIPTAPGVEQDRVVVSDPTDTEAEKRLSLRAKEALARLNVSSSSAPAVQAAVSSVMSSAASSVVSSVSSSAAAPLKPAATGFAGVAASTKSILTASSASSSSVTWAAVRPSVTATVTKGNMPSHLPDSGVGIWVAFAGALGAAAARVREHRRSALRREETLPS